MYIRCVECRSASWIESLPAGASSPSVTCANCGHKYALNGLAGLGESQRAQYQRALKVAEEHGIDLPRAYSVLLGILSPLQAKTLREPRAEDLA